MQLLYKKNGEWTNSSPNVHPLIGVNRISDQATAARALVEQLLKDGMIELNARFSDCRGHVAYQPTSKGNAMRSARLVPRLNRAKADKLLADFLRSVEEVNAHPDLLHWVTEVRVFGSYLTNSDDLGEIDLAIKKERRPASGSFSDAYPDRLVALLLKGGSRYISLHDVTELDEKFGVWRQDDLYVRAAKADVIAGQETVIILPCGRTCPPINIGRRARKHKGLLRVSWHQWSRPAEIPGWRQRGTSCRCNRPG